VEVNRGRCFRKPLVASPIKKEEESERQIYTERPNIETICCQAIKAKDQPIIHIKGPQKMGKTRLMKYILNFAKDIKYQTVSLDLRILEKPTHEELLTWLCERLCKELELNTGMSDFSIQQTPNQSCTDYFEKHILKNIETKLVLGLDNVDILFSEEFKEAAKNFFGLLRSWYDKSIGYCEIWQKLKIITVYSTEDTPKLNPYQSPFDVGLKISLPDFESQQITELANQYGLILTISEVDNLISIIGGHPYLVYITIQHLKRFPSENLSEILSIAATDQGIYREYLSRHWKDIDNNLELRNILREVINSSVPIRIDYKYSRILESMGLVRLCRSLVEPRYQLYRQYFSGRL
jgi:serine/threonine-protein kinase